MMAPLRRKMPTINGCKAAAALPNCTI